MTHKQLKASHTIICKIKDNGRVVKDKDGKVQIFDYDAGCKTYRQRQMSDEERRVATEMHAPDPKLIVGYIRFDETDKANASLLTVAEYEKCKNDEPPFMESLDILPITRELRDELFARL